MGRGWGGGKRLGGGQDWGGGETGGGGDKLQILRALTPTILESKQK